MRAVVMRIYSQLRIFFSYILFFSPGKWIRTLWKWHQDAYSLDIRLRFYVYPVHQLYWTIIFWLAHRKMVKCAPGIWLMANAKRMSNYHKYTQVFRHIICQIAMIYDYFVTVIMRKFLLWIRLVWKLYFHSAQKWSPIGFRHCM